MKVISTKFKDLKIIKNPKINDKRGYFRELSKENILKKKLPFCYTSLSKKNVVRGLHLQTKKQQSKLITVLTGKIFDVAVDLRKNSKTFKKYFSIILAENDNQSIFIPNGFAHGFMSLSDKTLLLYQCSNYRDKKNEVGIKWDDKNLDINWPKSKKYIISYKDKNNITFLDYKKIL